MHRIILISLLISLIGVSCSDKETIGLEVQPNSENIIISDASSFSWQTSLTESVDSLRTDEAGISEDRNGLILGEINNDLIFGYNSGTIVSQILLKENNANLGASPIIDSVVLLYTYSGYYGDLVDFTEIKVNKLNQAIYKDSIYYSSSIIANDNINWTKENEFSLSNDSESPFLRIKLKNEFAEDFFSNDKLVNNVSFLQDFSGISISAYASKTMLYLNPDGSNSYLRVYYHNNENDSLFLEFGLGGEAARFGVFSEKPLSNLDNQQNTSRYIQSMSGYKTKISITNTDSIKKILLGKVINKVNISFDVQSDSQSEYPAHDRLFLVRVDKEGRNLFLKDYTLESEAHFGGILFANKYEFNITRYFTELLNNDSYTNELYLISAGAAVNANRTILDKDIKLTIYYSDFFN
tara:strand:- start:309 stop:1538 length:1230 start_codon:yes stop_codon:yes gene_type:complete